MTARILVILLNYRTAQMTLRAAEAALADMPQDGAELVIIDNNSGDGSDAVLAREITARGWDKGGRVRLICSPVNGGFGAGCNIGFAAGMSDGTAPDYFYLLNSDAFPDPGCLKSLLALLEAKPTAGMVGSHIRGEDGVDHTSAFRFPTAWGEFEGAARLGPITRLLSRFVIAPQVPEAATRVDWVAGASVLIRAEMIAQTGGFDEGYFLYFEETDLCRRAANLGWECWYEPQARIVHIGSVSTGMKTWQRTPGYWFASRRRYFVQNHSRAYAAATWMARLAGGALHTLRCALSGRAPQDPPGFYRDLCRFGLGLTLDPSPAARGRPVSETKT